MFLALPCPTIVLSVADDLAAEGRKTLNTVRTQRADAARH